MVDAAKAGKPKIVTRRGKPTVAVVSIEDFEKPHPPEAQLMPSFTNHLLNMPSDGNEFERQPVKLRDFP